MTEETRCSLAASDKGSYHREWPPEPSNYEESIGASRQNILRTEERGLLNLIGLILIVIVTVHRQTILIFQPNKL